MNEAIAIVGMACIYPDANSPAELWENILAQRRAFRRIPSQRLRIEDYYSLDPRAVDQTYSSETAVIKDYEFDRVRFQVSGPTFRSTDPVHWLALDVCSRALADAGFHDGNELPRETTGVVLGNTLTGEFSRASLLRLRWPYVGRVLDSILIKQGWSKKKRREFIENVEFRFKAPFPAINEESLAGGLSNTIAGRICNQFCLKGGGFTVDGACASSLLALAETCSALAAGDLDVGLSGGVDLSLDPFELVGFAKAGALASDEMYIYDVRSAGFWPGEGCGFVVLMRHGDAIAQRKRIYCLIRGWGISSDGGGGITRPELEGQLLALRRAYSRAGLGIDTVSYFEGHGTGTATGDTIELEALSQARREASPNGGLAFIGSVKGNIGHTKAAAGVAGLIKATLAVHNQIIPPTTGCESPHALLTADRTSLRALSKAIPWPSDCPVRAGVSAMGFGGINTHVVIEAIAHRRRSKLTTHEQNLSDSIQDTELFLIGARSADELLKQVVHLAGLAFRISRSELTDLAAQLARKLSEKRVRAALVASTPAELASHLERLKECLSAGRLPQLDLHTGIFVRAGNTAPRIGFLFPGQGSPVYDNGGALGRRFPSVRDLYRRANLPVDGVTSSFVQRAVVTASLAGLRALDQVGIRANFAVGHSLGEITALYWAGSFEEGTVLRFAALRENAMNNLKENAGGMIAIEAPPAEVTKLLNDNYATVAGYNSLRQTVVSGEKRNLKAIARRAEAKGFRVSHLAVSHAFHSPLVAAAAPIIAEGLAHEVLRPIQRSVFSTVTGVQLPQDCDLRALLVRQVTSPVRFVDAINAIGSDIDFLIEVGPGNVLTGLVSDLVRVPVVTLDAGGISMNGLLNAAALAFVFGGHLNHLNYDVLFDRRFTRSFDLNWSPRFFANPCELAPILESREIPPKTDIKQRNESRRHDRRPEPSTVNDQDPGNSLIHCSSTVSRTAIATLRQILAQDIELPLSAIKNSNRLAKNFHLSSIKVAQIVAKTARNLGLQPLIGLTDYANATVEEIAEALENLRRTNRLASDDQDEQFPPGVASWVRAFTVELVECPRRNREQSFERGDWIVFAPHNHPLKLRLGQTLARQGKGSGVVVCLPADGNEYSNVRLLLDGANALVSTPPVSYFVLVQNGLGAAGFARTLHLERPNVSCCVIDLPFNHPRAVEWVIAEIGATDGYNEAHYDSLGVRREPRLCLAGPFEEEGNFLIDRGDVLLVTGGGKGIAAECALAIGRRTGVRLAILGRSRCGVDHELTRNLDRIKAAGVQCKYFTADVTDAEAVHNAIQETEQMLGPVTAVLHGAGTNVPQLITSLDEAAFRRTLAPKIEGMRNVLRAITPAKMKLLITFSSIIARTGLSGEADYAVANEWLSALTTRFQDQHPHCQCLALEWSIWSGTGMGQRLGRVDALARQGISAITVEDGVRIFLSLISHRRPHVAMVIASRFGEPSTLKLEKPRLPSLRFLENTRVFYPGVELVVDCELSPAKDLYLDDHIYQGQRLLPAVLGLEAMAQVAMALTGNSRPPIFKDAKFSRAVVVPVNGAIIRIAALVEQSDRVKIVLRSSETAFQVDCFQATCCFTQVSNGPSPLRERTDPADHLNFESPSLQLDPQCELYGRLLFHAGRFRKLVNYHQLTAKECRAEIALNGVTGWFSEDLPQELIFGDPGVRDAGLHAIQACLPHARVLPVGFDQANIQIISTDRRRIVHAKERYHDSNSFIYDLIVSDSLGRELERWWGLRLQVVERLTGTTRWSVTLLGPYVERTLQKLLPVLEISVALVISPDNASKTALQDALATKTAIWKRPDGKPEADQLFVSAADAADLQLAVTGNGPLGCDIEFVHSRTTGQWDDLLGRQGALLAKTIAKTTGEKRGKYSVAATRVWVAKESLKKAGAPADSPLILQSESESGWITLTTGSFTVITYVTKLKSHDDLIVLGLAAMEVGMKVSNNNESRNKAYEYRHVVGFEETNVVGNVYYVNHLSWQGRCREMFLSEHAPNILAELRSGLYLATTKCSCEYFAELSAFDDVLIQMRLAQLTDDSMSLSFEYWRTGSSDAEKVAQGYQTIVCLRKDGDQKHRIPIPVELRAALEKYQ